MLICWVCLTCTRRVWSKPWRCDCAHCNGVVRVHGQLALTAG